jgi:hypothetical protein
MERKYKIKLLMAGIGYGLFVISILGLIMLMESLENQAPTTAQLRLTQLAVIGGVVAWLSLLAHFFQNRKIKYRTLWGFSLIFLWWIAGPLYLYLQLRKGK